jgi:flagellar biosynthesis regulator FlaF
LDASLRHPANQLPQDTKVTMIQVGRTVMREMENAAPDLAFLIEINEQLTSGLR